MMLQAISEDTYQLKGRGTVYTFTTPQSWDGLKPELGMHIKIDDKVIKVRGIERFCLYLGEPFKSGENIGVWGEAANE